jgi:hypothetical protein
VSCFQTRAGRRTRASKTWHSPPTTRPRRRRRAEHLPRDAAVVYRNALGQYQSVQSSSRKTAISSTIDGEISLSALLPTVETTGQQIASGIVEIDGADVVALFRRENPSRKPAIIRRFRRSKKADWEWIARPAGGIAIAAVDVIILRSEFERCERAWGLFDISRADAAAKSPAPPKRPPGPGAPPKHDCDAFAGAIARRVHDQGMPVSQGELVRI